MSLISDAFAVTDRIKKLLEKAKDAQIRDELVSLQMLFIEIINENQQLKKELDMLKDIEEKEQQIERTNGNIAKYKNKNKEFYICTNCWDSARTIVQVEKLGGNNNDFRCPNCENISFYGERKIFDTSY